MDRFRNIIRTALLAAFTLAAVSCGEKDCVPYAGGNTVAVDLDIGLSEIFTKGFDTGDDRHDIDRILILPFRKTDEAFADADANLIPVAAQAMHLDASAYPLEGIKIELTRGKTYSLLVIGYNHSDYDHAAPLSASNKFTTGATSLPATLANYHVKLKNATDTPEIFSCVCIAYDGATPAGTYFKPEQHHLLKGQLRRLVSGLSLKITAIPEIIKSITLRPERLALSCHVTDGGHDTYETLPANLSYGKQVPAGNTVSFKKLLLPVTNEPLLPRLFLDIEFGTHTETHILKVNDGGTVTEQFSFARNIATNITGTYDKIGLGFELLFRDCINLDDDIWDGL